MAAERHRQNVRRLRRTRSLFLADLCIFTRIYGRPRCPGAVHIGGMFVCLFAAASPAGREAEDLREATPTPEILRNIKNNLILSSWQIYRAPLYM